MSDKNRVNLDDGFYLVRSGEASARLPSEVVVSRTDLEAAAMDVDFRAEAYEAAGWQISAAATRALADRLRAVLDQGAT